MPTSLRVSPVITAVLSLVMAQKVQKSRVQGEGENSRLIWNCRRDNPRTRLVYFLFFFLLFFFFGA